MVRCGGVVLHGFLSILTAVVLLAHAVLGCCAHHEHACGQPHSHMALTSEHPCADTTHEHSAVTPEQSHHQHPGSDACRGGSCDLGRPQNEQVGKSAISGPTLALPLSAVTHVTVGGRLELDLGTTGVLLPVRLHLVNQVLLI
jgi:hypothetical protein